MSGSTAKITHNAGSGSGFASRFTSFRPGPSSSMLLWSNTFSTITQPGHFSVGAGGIGAVTNPTTATFALKTGTGVSQTDPVAAPSWGASSLTLEFEGRWRTTSTPNPAFGPIATAYFSMSYVGVNTGIGVNPMTLTLNYYIGTNPTPVRSVTKTDTTPFGASPQNPRPYTYSYAYPSVAPNTDIRVKGVITFAANNDNAPAFCDPLNMDFGAAPPTANWQSDAGGNWNDATKWTLPAGTFEGDSIINGVPNGVGQRARFANLNTVSTSPTSRTVNVNTAVTLGTLNIDADDAYNFTASSGGSLRFEVQEGEAVIENGVSDGGGIDDVIGAPVVLGSSVVVQTAGERADESLRGGIAGAANLVIDAQISGTGANTQGVTKLGEASLTLNVANLYGGGTGAKGGYLNAEVTGSLGVGTVLADDGQLNYNAPNAAAPGIVSNAQNNGQINLGIVPTSERFALHDLGAVSGSPAELTALSVLAGGNLTVDPGAMIAHESFDFAAGGNPIGLFNAGTASYIFGIAADFANSGTFETTVGSTSGTIWKGFGGDRENRTFGFDPNTATLLLGIAGTTELVSLHNTTTINARVVNAGAGSIIKRGGGTVVLNNVNNTYAGPITIQAGTLAVGGGLNNLTTVNINGLNAGFAVRPGGSVTGTTVSINGGGQLVMIGGSLNCGTLQNVDGELHVNAGTLNVTNFMNGNPSFFAQFSGGHTSVGSYAASGTILIDGGRLAVNGALIGVATGTVILDSGTLTTGAGTLSQLHGQTFVNGGVATFANNLTVGPAGFLRYNGGSINVAGTLTVSGGTVLIGTSAERLLRLGNVATPSGGRLDLNDSDMVATASTYAAIRGLVASARGSGNWLGAGITSTAARNTLPAATTLGVLTGAQYLTTGNTLFDGHTVVTSDVLVKYTYYGDTDFNGDINFDDYARIDAGFNSGGTSWFTGDFDFNSTVNFDDYALIDLAFNVQSGTLRPAMQFLTGGGLDASPLPPSLQQVVDHYAQFGDAYAQSFLAAVPEPASASTAAALLLGMLMPRRRIRTP